MSQVLFGKYALREPIGLGPHGVLWRATELETGGSHAVKIIGPPYTADRRITARVLRAAGMMAEPVHPAWVPVDEVLAAEGCLALVSGLVAGEDLRRLLSRRGVLPEAEAAHVVLACAEALAAAHAKGLAHHNLRLSNVLADEGGRRIWVTDARLDLIEPADAPEPSPARPSADIYQLGAVLYELITGRPAPDTAGEALVLPRWVSPEMTHLIRYCLSPWSAERPTASEVSAVLRRMLSRPHVPLSPLPRTAAVPRLTQPDLPFTTTSPPRRPAAVHVPASAAPPAPTETPVPEAPPAEPPAETERVRRHPLLLATVGLLTAAVGAATFGVTRAPHQPPLSASAATTPSATAGAPGAVPFVELWFAALNHALATGDTEALTAASAPSCTTCSATSTAITAAFRDGGFLRDSAYLVRRVESEGPADPARPVLEVVVDRSPGVVVTPDGQMHRGVPRLESATMRIRLVKRGREWAVADLPVTVPLA